MPRSLRSCALLLAFTLPLAVIPLHAQDAGASKTPEQQRWDAEQARIEAGNAADYADMLQKLGLRRDQIRPGVDGYGKGPHPVNYNQDAVPAFTLPDPLALPDGSRVTRPGEWWLHRRPEIEQQLADDLYGHAPESTPDVHWSVMATTPGNVGGKAAVTQKLIGHVDNRADPAITVDIDVELTLPAHPEGKVPVMIAFDWPPSFWAEFARRTGHTFPPPPGPTAREQVLAKGWGYALLVPTSVQADNGAGLTQGIIGLCNHGQRRTPEQWGALRAWGWGAGKLLDYFGTQPNVDVHRVGIFGHSRYGKAALVTMAFDHRFAIGYISSSGEGGAKPSRRLYGELLENVAADGEYHWMAGNFLRYASVKTASDLPVDAHDLIALCAPRAVFLSGGTQTAGDGWVDAKGSFLSAVAAGPVYRLLGAQDLGTTTPPPVLTEVGNGPLAYRQHDQGHTPAPNWPFFLAFAQRELYGPDFALNFKAQR